MAYEKRDMTFSVFKNKRKETDNHPDLTGTALVNGIEYWVSAWKKKDKNGDTWLSGALKLMEPQKENSDNWGATKAAGLGEDEIPF